MAETITSSATKTCAVVTGANRGIGFEICQQLASREVVVVLTARDERRGVEAVENLIGFGLSNVVFHQLDVMDLASIASLADFIKTQFGKLDILVNNAGISVILDHNALEAFKHGNSEVEGAMPNWNEVTTHTYELADECLQANYYGTKRVTEALLPLLQLSNSARIVNVSSSLGKLEGISYEKAKEVLSDVDGLTEERVGELLNGFLKDFKDLIETKGQITNFFAYRVSKATINAYTRILAKKFPNFFNNSVCPGYVRTDINNHIGLLNC